MMEPDYDSVGSNSSFGFKLHRSKSLPHIDKCQFGKSVPDYKEDSGINSCSEVSAVSAAAYAAAVVVQGDFASGSGMLPSEPQSMAEPEGQIGTNWIYPLFSFLISFYGKLYTVGKILEPNLLCSEKTLWLFKIKSWSLNWSWICSLMLKCGYFAERLCKWNEICCSQIVCNNGEMQTEMYPSQKVLSRKNVR